MKTFLYVPFPKRNNVHKIGKIATTKIYNDTTYHHPIDGTVLDSDDDELMPQIKNNNNNDDGIIEKQDNNDDDDTFMSDIKINDDDSVSSSDVPIVDDKKNISIKIKSVSPQSITSTIILPDNSETTTNKPLKRNLSDMQSSDQVIPPLPLPPLPLPTFELNVPVPPMEELNNCVQHINKRRKLNPNKDLTNNCDSIDNNNNEPQEQQNVFNNNNEDINCDTNNQFNEPQEQNFNEQQQQNMNDNIDDNDIEMNDENKDNNFVVNNNDDDNKCSSVDNDDDIEMTESNMKNNNTITTPDNMKRHQPPLSKQTHINNSSPIPINSSVDNNNNCEFSSPSSTLTPSFDSGTIKNIISQTNFDTINFYKTIFIIKN